MERGSSTVEWMKVEDMEGGGGSSSVGWMKEEDVERAGEVQYL